VVIYQLPPFLVAISKEALRGVEQYRIARSIENASSRSRVLAQVAAAMAAVDPKQAARLGAVEIRAPLTKISNATEDTVLRASNGRD
jgi:hypothetical protein